MILIVAFMIKYNFFFPVSSVQLNMKIIISVIGMILNTSFTALVYFVFFLLFANQSIYIYNIDCS